VHAFKAFLSGQSIQSFLNRLDSVQLGHFIGKLMILGAQDSGVGLGGAAGRAPAPGLPDSWPRQLAVLLLLAGVPAFAEAQAAARVAALTENHCQEYTDLPDYRVAGVAHPVVSLDGRWEVALASAAAVLADANAGNAPHWRPVEVPGEVLMQGVPAERDIPFCYRRLLDVPGDFAGQRILLCFDGVYSDARVFVGRREVGSHAGGFTPWAVDLTDSVRPGETAPLLVEVTDRRSEVSYGSGYAHHSIAGILRNVRLRADPKDRIEDWRAVTTLDAGGADARLALRFALRLSEPATLSIRLSDPSGKPLELRSPRLTLAAGEESANLDIAVGKPQLWTAETPALYRLEVALSEGARVVQSFAQTVGVREIRLAGDRLLVNGRPVKLRGACRHDMHPLLGRVSTPDYEELDVRLAKEANMNFIRTSHYPPTRNFLELCDRYGLYVEVESAVCFVSPDRSAADIGVRIAGPEFREEMLGQIRAMERDGRNHPCVLYWSIGNESLYDENFQASYDYLRATDPSRPVIFSYPGSVPAGRRPYDILSVHYPDAMGNGGTESTGLTYEGLHVQGMPVVFDEWAHVPCYATAELSEDPNMRDAWGPSIDRMWQVAYAQPGTLGGAIWGMIDETFSLPTDVLGWGATTGARAQLDAARGAAGPQIGYGPWGIVDIWRRRKPEFWHTKKAYSPVRLLVREATRDPATGEVRLPVENRHDHVDLTGFLVHWSRAGGNGVLALPPIPPHSRGTMTLAPGVVGAGDLRLQVESPGRQLVDEETLALEPGRSEAPAEQSRTGPLLWSETVAERILTGSGFRMQFSRETGLLTEVTAGGAPVLLGGPRLTFRTAEYPNGRGSVARYPERVQRWHLLASEYGAANGVAQVRVTGEVDERHTAEFALRIGGDGRMQVSYRVPALSGELVREVGVVFDTTPAVAAVTWTRDAYWTAYPDDHPGRPNGRERMRTDQAVLYRQEPRGSWWHDDKDFFLLGLEDPSYRFGLTAAARSTHENLRRLALLSSDGRERLVVVGDGSVAARIDQQEAGRMRLRLLGYWDYPNMLWGNLSKQIRLAGPVTGAFIVDLCPHATRG
jgi:beta-galactosidase